MSETCRPLILITYYATGISITITVEKWKYLISYEYSTKNGFVYNGEVEMNVTSKMEFPYERNSASLVFFEVRKECTIQK
jgi:hypothetical protein